MRTLGAADEAAFRTFLAPRADSSMFLLSNARSAGLVDEGKPLQATYVGAFANGQLVGVAAHCWNGIVLVQTPANLIAADEIGRLVASAVKHSGRTIQGFSGPADQVAIARRAFTLPAATLDKNEALYALTLADLRVPPALGRHVCRAPTAAELPALHAWRRAYALETLGADDVPEIAERSRREVDQLAQLGQLWVLEAHGEVVATSGFNARLPEIVQVGGVYTPPELRGRGYARCVVAGSLLDARSEGAARAILFTQSAAAARAYEAIGFRQVGEYALVLL